MAPLKRNRRAGDDYEEDDEVVDVQEARSSLQSTSRKRARVSMEEPKSPPPQTRFETTAPPSDSEHDDDSDSPDTPPQTQYELMRDAGFKHLQHTDKDDHQATQKLLRRPSQLGNNRVAGGGIIDSITCINFMCHERLHVELGPLINFVVGENGSGKSAVLTALTLCLGGKASDTNRGGSLKSFVKEGRDQCTLIVRIKNAGSDAYKPDIYGDSIIVERSFSRTGSSGFKIKSTTDRTISTKKAEVEEISEWYALQIGNPLTVLSQDNARQFLNSATPAQKYKYFVSGVQLEQLDNDYKLAQDTLEKNLLARDDLEITVAQVKKDMEDAQRLSETARKNQSLRDKARHYRTQLIWAQVVEQEKQLDVRNADLAGREQDIAHAEEECEELTKALLSVEDKLARMNTDREALDLEKGTFEEKTAAAEAFYHAAKKELTDLHREERDAFSRLKTLKEDMEVREEKIREEEQRLGESTGSARAEKDAELSRANEREADLEDTRMPEHKQQKPVFEGKLAEAEQIWRKAQALKDIKRKEIVATEQQVRELEKNTSSAYAGFDRDITTLVKAIDDDKSFDHKPIGPLGAHIKLLKPEWSGILEKTLGEGLNAFVVRSKRDQTRLSTMFRRMGLKRPPPIYIAYGGRIDTRNQEPDDKFDTILRVLEFDDELIRSQLVINNQIEKIILVKERRDAEQIMIDDGPPRNVKACLCFHDGKAKRGQGLRITNRNGALGSGPISVTTQRPRMQSDSVRQIAWQKEHLRQLGVELRELNGEERLSQQAVQRCKNELNDYHKGTKALENEKVRARAEVERISEELDAFEGVDDRLEVLRGERDAKRDEHTQLGAQYGNMALAKRDLSGKAEQAKKMLNDERTEANEYQARINKAAQKVQSTDSLRRITVTKKNAAYEKLDISKAERRRAEEKRDLQVSEVEQFVQQASSIAPDRVYIPDGETHASIEKKYEKVSGQLKQRQDRLGATDEQIYERAAEAKKTYDEVTKQTRDVDLTVASLKQAIRQRLHLWRQFQRQISARVRIQFNYLLSERGFRGKIDLDHRFRKVNIQIEPDETRKSSSGRNTKTLSGGEKSFSSICMLLSVWEAIGSPIRCLDEFDVFMDNVNRAISTNMLVDAARRSVSRQYILITPNAIEGRARLDRDVKIIRLTDPRQRTLV